MRADGLFLLLLAMALAVAGCGSIQVEAGFKQPAELTATAVARAAPASPTATPRPRLGRLAFVRGGDIWAKELPDGEARRLTKDGHNSEPLWSPSGEWLTFRKGEPPNDQLWLIRAAGTDAHQLDTGTISRIAWSPLRDQVAYSLNGGLYLANADGSGRRELVSPPGKEPGGSSVMSVAWSPDGEWIAFHRTDRGTPGTPTWIYQGLWRIRADGTDAAEVYHNPDPRETQGYLAGWWPDGQHFLFWQGKHMSASMLADGAPLMAVPVAGGPPVQLAERVLYRQDAFDGSPDGRRLALVAGGRRDSWENKAIAVANPTGGLQRLSDLGRADLFPAWSPDGRRIAFAGAPEAPGATGGDTAKQAMAQRKIWVMAPDGSDKRQLTDDPRFRDERPRWSRDGSHILFGRFQDEQMQVWLMRSDGSDLKQVVDELTPTPGPAPGWFGYYGYVDWYRVYDWWPGPPSPRRSPPPLGTSTPQTSPTPSGAASPPSGPRAGATVVAEDLSAFLQAAAAYLESGDARGQPEAVVSGGLQQVARSRGLWLSYLKRSEGEPEAWIGASPAGAFMLWRQGGKAAYQSWTNRNESFAMSLFNPVRAFRLAERDGILEMALITANFGNTADAWFLLARLMDGKWQERWSPAKAPKDSWAGGGGKVEFLGMGIDAFRMTGPIPMDVPASRVFEEFGGSGMQQYESEWRRQGDSYVRVTGHIVPTPMTALANFIDRLQRDDLAGAARFAVNPAVVKEAIELGLNGRPSGNGWAGAMQIGTEETSRVRFMDRQRLEGVFTATLVRQAGEWRVKAIEQMPIHMEPPPGATAAPTIKGGG